MRKVLSRVVPAVWLAVALALAGCGNLADMFDFSSGGEVQESADTLLVEAMDDFSVGKYASALEKFDEILDRYPFSKQALLAELKAADCHYYQEEYVEAKTLYEQFLDQHPTNEVIPYVMFQIGMCDYRRIDRIDRDITAAKDAIASFSALLRAYPDSPYSREARSRIAACREFLINHEYFVAVFYVRTARYDEAKHRLRYLLATYPDAAIAPKAKALLARLEAGDPPRWGIRKWLPSMHLPDWLLFGEQAREKPKDDRQAAGR